MGTRDRKNNQCIERKGIRVGYQEEAIRTYIANEQYQIAIELCKAVLKENKDAFEIQFLMGVAYQKQGQLKEAELIYRTLAKTQKSTGIFSNFAVLLDAMGEVDEAILYDEKALKLDPNYFDARSHLAALFQKKNEYSLAQKHLHYLIQHYPDNVDIIQRYAANCDFLGLLDEATTYFKKAIDLAPNHAVCHTSYGIELLLQGHFKLGWREFHWRNLQEDRQRLFPFPEWHGEPIAGKRLLVCAEQGIGDALQFMRYLPLLSSFDAKIILECHPELYTFCSQQSFAKQIITIGSSLPSCDYYVHLVSLAEIFKTDLSNIPNKVPYITVPTALLEKWQQTLRGLKQYRVGIVWAGSPIFLKDKQRSLALEKYLPFLRLSGIDYVSLQKGEQAFLLAQLPPGVKVMNVEKNLTDYLETAACISQLDLVITVDTSVAHLAGALGKAVWVLLPYVPDWRWLLDRNDSPWYPTMQLFRQAELGDWDSVIEAVRRALQAR